MKTLTITEAKKNLGKLLQAAARGENIGVISGADIIALRKVEVESTDYAFREYGVTSAQLEELERATGRRFQKLKRTGSVKMTTHDQLRGLLEKAAGA